MALHSRAPPVGQSKPRSTPDVLRALEAPAHDERRAALRADGRRGLRVTPVTPQSSFMILAPVIPQREAELRRLLASMNDGPGRLKPDNGLIPFQQFDTLHVARLLIVDDKTREDVRLYGIAPRTYPLYLTLLGDVDGDPDDFLRELARRAPAGLRTIFSHCEGFHLADRPRRLDENP